MIRSDVSWDDQGKSSCKVRLSAREIARGMAATGLPAGVFEGTFAMFQVGDKRFFPGSAQKGPLYEWLTTHANGLPKWQPIALRNEEDGVEEFALAGHRFETDVDGRRDLDWHDERGEPHIGCMCAVCGYGVDTGRTLPADVPDCDGPEGKVRRRKAYRAHAMKRLRDADMALYHAERQADVLMERGAFYATHALDMDHMRGLLLDVVFSIEKHQVMDVAIAVRAVDSLAMMWAGGDVRRLGAPLRYLIARVEEDPDR